MNRQLITTAERTIHRETASASASAFTLVELLVVLAILLALVALVMPAFAQSRMQARMLRVHSDLRQVGIALEGYALTNEMHFPPTRSGCGTDVTYQLPVELAVGEYLPRHQSAIPQADFPDPFDPERTYRYLAPGPIWFNGTFFDFPDSTWRPRAGIWVPDDFPACESETGQVYHDRRSEPRSPVSYAVWSIGPDAQSPRFPRDSATGTIDASRFPLFKDYWMHGPGDTGLITHFRGREGDSHMSP